MDESVKRSLEILNQDNKSFFNRAYNLGRAWTLISPGHIEKYLPKGKIKLIDVGSGSGMIALCLHFNNRERKIFGYDLNRTRIENLNRIIKRNKLKNLEFVQRNVNDKNNLGSADAVLMCDLLHHISREDQIKLLKNTKKLLAKKGILIIKDINKESSYKLLITWVLDLIITKGDRINYRNIDEWEKILGGLGYDVVKAEKVRNFFYPHIIIVCRRSTK